MTAPTHETDLSKSELLILMNLIKYERFTASRVQRVAKYGFNRTARMLENWVKLGVVERFEVDGFQRWEFKVNSLVFNEGQV